MTDDRPSTATAEAEAEAPPTKEEPKGDGDEASRPRLGFLTELPFLLLISLVLALLIKTFVFQAFYIPSESMVPTLEIGDRVLVNKIVYHLHPPRRGDVIVFSDPNPIPEPDRGPLRAFWNWLTEGLGVSTGTEKDFIKRVIGLPGETVEVQSGDVYIDGERLQDEPYLSDIADGSDWGPERIPDDNVFVMGDNRTRSSDSRSTLGPIPYDNVIGRAFIIIWPPSRAGLLRTVSYRSEMAAAGMAFVPAGDPLALAGAAGLATLFVRRGRAGPGGRRRALRRPGGRRPAT